ncbi:GGDEF domain-containing protein [Nodosilinea sp. FACHB-13]|uniref:GGDEF domain-containing protein n=1 Tax=Cyanophyceae TaxID=3028117 RepID=UPI0016827A33|nr:GGDEF domain-containing protein [Nodosilinea sp. FACHB-13]
MMTQIKETPCQEREDDCPNLALLIQDGERRQIMPLGKRFYSIGRDRTKDIRLVSEGVSGHHASLVWLDHCYVIHSDDATNGPSCQPLTINDTPVQTSPLRPGDAIGFCHGVRARLITVRSGLPVAPPLCLLPPAHTIEPGAGLLNHFPDLMLKFDANGSILDVKPSVDPDLSRLPIAAGQSIVSCFESSFAAKLFSYGQMASRTQSLQCFEAELTVEQQKIFCEARLLPTEQGHRIAIIRNVTERKRLELELRSGAIHDTLTSLPNRRFFMEKAAQAIALKRTSAAYSFAVLFIDLDDFKGVNDSLGHRVGDQLLVEIALQLKACLRPQDTVARLGGDEFAILLHEVASGEAAVAVATRIQQALALPLLRDHPEVCSSASIGIALGTEGDDSVEAMLNHADMAMYRAKALGGSQYAVFDPAIDPA